MLAKGARGPASTLPGGKKPAMDETRANQRIQTVCLLLLTTTAMAASLYWLRPVMIPFVMAVLFALGLAPLIDLQMRYLRAPRSVAGRRSTSSPLSPE